MSDIVEHVSAVPFDATLERLTAAIGEAGLILFAQVDHQAGARDAGLEMAPATVLIYRHAKGGTAVMFAAPLAALDLPLRVVWSAAGLVDTEIRVFHEIGGCR